MAKFSIRKWAKICVALGGVAFSATAAQAGDPCACVPLTGSCTQAQCCDALYQQAGNQLAVELCRLTEECCTDECCDSGCCETDCAAPAECCDTDCCVDSCDGTSHECGGFLKGLFGKHHTDLACDDCCVDDCIVDSCDGCGSEDNGWDFGGWVQIGYHSSSTSGNGALEFNDQPHRVNFHQVWMYAEKVADGSDGIGFGGRVDFMYGIDAGDTQSFGNEPGNWDFQNGWDRGGGYGFAMPQLYGEVAMGDLSIIAGHFYTLLGYEVVTAPDNFFYSHAYTMVNSEAFTHTGVLATYAASDNVTLYGGWTLGWDTGFDQFNDGGVDPSTTNLGETGSSFLGGYSVGLGENASLTHIITAGNFGLLGDGFSQSVVVDVALTDDLNYVFQSDYLNAEGPDSGDGTLETVGVNQYLLYSLSDKVGIGGRAEWWKVDGNSVYAFTAGLNIKPTDNLIIRPELRYQGDPGQSQDIVGSEDETVFGIDAIFTF